MNKIFNEFTSLGALEELHRRELEAHRQQKEVSRSERIQEMVNSKRISLPIDQSEFRQKDLIFSPPGMQANQLPKDSEVWAKCASEIQRLDQIEEHQLVARQQLDIKRLVDQWARGDSAILNPETMAARSLPQPMPEEERSSADRAPLEFNQQATRIRVDSRPNLPEVRRFEMESKNQAFGLHDSSAPSQRPPRTPDEEKLYQEKLAQLRADAIKREEMKKNFNDLTKGRER